MWTKDQIFITLNAYKKQLEQQGHNVYAIMLKGSQNYNLDDEESDVDANAIIIPTLADLRNKQSYKYKFESGEVTCHDIYSFAEIVAKGNPQWIEVCHTEYVVGNDISMFQHYELNPSALKGMLMEKVHAFSKLYPSRKSIVEEFGYDPKQLHHIIRLYHLLEEDKKVIKYEGQLQEYMLNIKRGRFPSSVEEAIALRDRFVERLNEIYEKRKLKYQPQEVDYDLLDKIVAKEICNGTNK